MYDGRTARFRQIVVVDVVLKSYALHLNREVGRSVVCTPYYGIRCVTPRHIYMLSEFGHVYEIGHYCMVRMCTHIRVHSQDYQSIVYSGTYDVWCSRRFDHGHA